MLICLRNLKFTFSSRLLIVICVTALITMVSSSVKNHSNNENKNNRVTAQPLTIQSQNTAETKLFIKENGLYRVVSSTPSRNSSKLQHAHPKNSIDTAKLDGWRSYTRGNLYDRNNVEDEPQRDTNLLQHVGSAINWRGQLPQQSSKHEFNKKYRPGEKYKGQLQHRKNIVSRKNVDSKKIYYPNFQIYFVNNISKPSYMSVTHSDETNFREKKETNGTRVKTLEKYSLEEVNDIFFSGRSELDYLLKFSEDEGNKASFLVRPKIDEALRKSKREIRNRHPEFRQFNVVGKRKRRSSDSIKHGFKHSSSRKPRFISSKFRATGFTGSDSRTQKLRISNSRIARFKSSVSRALRKSKRSTSQSHSGILDVWDDSDELTEENHNSKQLAALSHRLLPDSDISSIVPSAFPTSNSAAGAFPHPANLKKSHKIRRRQKNYHQKHKMAEVGSSPEDKNSNTLESLMPIEQDGSVEDHSLDIGDNILARYPGQDDYVCEYYFSFFTTYKYKEISSMK